MLYKSLVRPHLEYTNVTWGPSYIGDVQMIEKVQRRATKCILELVDLEYDDRRMALNLPSLSYRRHHADMLMVHNILHEIVGLQPPMFFHQQLSSIARGHDLKLFNLMLKRLFVVTFFRLELSLLGISYQMKKLLLIQPIISRLNGTIY